MIDIHIHILPGLDDGAKTIEESIEMCWMSYRDGVRGIVATPHMQSDSYPNDRSAVLLKVQELNDALGHGAGQTEDPGRQNSRREIPGHSENHDPQTKPDLRIFPGADVHLSERILRDLDGGKVTTINDRGKAILIEFPFHGIPYGAEGVLSQLIQRGITPIITHPERNVEIGQRPRRFYEMVKMGCLGQVTAMSLTGEFGHKMKQLAETLLAHRLIHFIASDGHSTNGRPPILSKAVRAAARMVGRGEAQKMVTEYPQSILEGQKPVVPEPIPF